MISPFHLVLLSERFRHGIFDRIKCEEGEEEFFQLTLVVFLFDDTVLTSFSFFSCILLGDRSITRFLI